MNECIEECDYKFIGYEEGVETYIDYVYYYGED